MKKRLYEPTTHPITGFKPPRRNAQSKENQAQRKKDSALYRSKQKLKTNN